MGRLVHLANLPLRLVRPKFRENITEAVFKTIPSVTKIEIRAFLQKVYGLEIASLETLNYEGEKKRKGATTYFYREPDWKKVYVRLKSPVTIPQEVFDTLPPEKAPLQKKERGGRKARREAASAAAAAQTS